MAIWAMRTGAAHGAVSEGDDWRAAAAIAGDGGNNRLNGTSGDDEINGRGGADRIKGLAGDDVLRGGNGDDELRGGNGHDVLIGGMGSDTFRFDAADGRDRISDFQRADYIRFSIDENDSGPRQYEDLTFTERGGGTEIAYGSSGGTIFLAGVAMNQIDDSQFIFL